VDEIYRRWSRDARRGGGGELTELTGDLGDDSVERSAQHGARKVSLRSGDACLGLLGLGTRGVATSALGLRFGHSAIQSIVADEALFLQLAGALGIAFGQVRAQAGLPRAQASRPELVLCQPLVGDQILV